MDVNGEVVGVNTFILSQSGGNEGLGFAIPCGVVSIAYQQLRKFGHLHRPEIGISVQTITPLLAEGLKLPRKSGVVISDALPDGPAEAARVRIGDVLLGIDGKAARSVPYVVFHLMSREGGNKVHLDVLRGDLRLGFDVPLMEPPKDMDQITALADPEKNLVPALGILAVEIDKKIAAMAPDLRDPFGIIVAARAAGSATEAPLTTGDVIRTLNGQPMTTLDRLRDALKALPAGAAVVLQIQRDQKLMYVVLTLGAIRLPWRDGSQSGIQLRVDAELSHTIHEGGSVDTQADCSTIGTTDTALACGKRVYDLPALLPFILLGASVDVRP